MALKDIVVASEVVTLSSGDDFKVYGITPEAITFLFVEGHKDEMERAMNTVQLAMTRNGELSDQDFIGAIAGIIAELPVMVAKLIAVCAQEPEQWPKVRQMSLAVQLDALMKIYKLTFDGPDALKKFLTSLITLAIQARGAATPIANGIADGLTGMKA